MSEKKKFLLRLNKDVFDAIERWAADDLRSVNAQIEFLLTDVLKKAGRAKQKKLHDGDEPQGEGAA